MVSPPVPDLQAVTVQGTVSGITPMPGSLLYFLNGTKQGIATVAASGAFSFSLPAPAPGHQYVSPAGHYRPPGYLEHLDRLTPPTSK